jgi:hypothetical protein
MKSSRSLCLSIRLRPGSTKGALPSVMPLAETGYVSRTSLGGTMGTVIVRSHLGALESEDTDLPACLDVVTIQRGLSACAIRMTRAGLHTPVFHSPPTANTRKVNVEPWRKIPIIPRVASAGNPMLCILVIRDSVRVPPST